MKLKIKKLHPDATIPTYATNGSGCFDIYSLDGGCVFSSAVFDTGIAFEIPEGHVMLVFSRSGHGFKNDIRLANAVGVIDSDYRNAVKVKLTSDNPTDVFKVEKGDRIAQAIILPYPKVEFVEGELSDTERGIGGFGSTGR